MPSTFPRGAAQALATVSKPSKGIYLLSMHNLPDNRLTPDFIKLALLPALDHIELNFRTNWNEGDKEAALVLTGERTKGKFFSNGLQLELVGECPGFFKDYYFKLMHRILTFPMHTVAAINGHCFAGGFCLAQCTDHRIMKAEKAWTAMNELDFGAPLPWGMAAVLKARLSPTTLRRVMLTAHRFTAQEALQAGIIDEVVDGDGEETIKRALAIAQLHAKHSASGVLSMLKERIMADAVEGLQIDEEMTLPDEQNANRFKLLQEAAVAAPKL